MRQHASNPRQLYLDNVLLLALALDWLAGEPPAALHPVVWLGRFISALEHRAPRNNPRLELVYGAGMTAATVAAAVGPALLASRLSRYLSRVTPPASHITPRISRVTPLAALTHAFLLKTAFSWRTLHQAAARVEQALAMGDLPTARERLSWLVSRDTSQLDEAQIAAAAIESLAENASDSVVAPLLSYALAGLPGAWAYRAVNTLDAMVGYRGRYEYLGKFPARLDDVANLLPARLTALLIVAAAGRGNARQAWRVLRQDRARTDSPNAGYPMSAIAGVLDVRLEKVGHYCLNAPGRAPAADDVRRASRVVLVALGITAALAAAQRYAARVVANALSCICYNR